MPARKPGASPRSTGVGASRTFNAPAGTFEDDRSNPRHLANCTLNGQPIPEHLWSTLPWDLTDQAYEAKANDGRPRASGSIEVTRDEVSQSIRRRGGDLERGMESDEAFDPMQELVREYVPAGMRPKFLSKRKVHAEGTTRGYTICTDAKGDPVTLGTSVLGYMPEDRAARIQAGFEEKSHAAQREIHGEDFDPRNPGALRHERVNKRVPKQEGDLSSSLTGGSFASFEDPGPEGPYPAGSDVGLQGDGEGFQL